MRMMGPAALVTVLLLAGCAPRMPYAPPVATVPATFSTGASAPAGPELDWWKTFDDPTLSALVARALAANLDVQEAASRVRQARLQARITRGNEGPQLNASAQASAARLSKNALPSALTNLFSGGSGAPSGGGLGLPGESFTTYQLGFDASWELDLFGGQRSADAAAAARAGAAVWSRRDAEVMLAAEVANTYQQYRALQRRLALAADSLEIQQEILAFAQVRVSHGLVAGPDRQRQVRAVQQASAARDDLAAQAKTRLHALALLLGLAPDALAGELASPPAAAPVLADAPPGLPSELLQRRPDIRAAERQVAAASAEVGVATAALYPKISLTGGLQLASRSLTTLLQSDSLQDNAAGRVSLPLLRRGQLHATVDLRRAQADETILAYRKAVLSALREVEDALTRLDADRRRLEQYRARTEAARDDADTAEVQFRNGLVPAAEALNSRQAWRSAADDQVQVEAAAAQDMVALYKALGGGWGKRRSSSEEDPPRGKAD